MVEDERRILEGFWEVVRSARDWRFVTYNGLAFDLPYLIRRSIYVGVPSSSGLPLRPFAPDRHFDVMRILSNWERSDAVRLDVVAELLGLQKWPPGMEGSQVLGLWRAGGSTTSRPTAWATSGSPTTSFSGSSPTSGSGGAPLRPRSGCGEALPDDRDEAVVVRASPARDSTRASLLSPVSVITQQIVPAGSRAPSARSRRAAASVATPVGPA